MAATFSTSGLASGLDTASIVDKLAQLASAPITEIKKQQSGLKSQVSALADIAGKLSAFQAAVASLGSAGALGVQVTGQNTAFQATAGTAAAAGSFAVQVTALAQAAKSRSTGFLSTETVTGGTLHLGVQGATFDIAVADGASLADVAAAIRASGAPVAATILTSGTSSYLSLTDLASGYPLAGVPGDALAVTQDLTGTAGKPLAFAPVQAAANAAFTVDGLPFTRTSNLVADALPGVTLTLQEAGGPAEALGLAIDAKATQDRLQTLVDAYNAAMTALGAQLSPAPNTDRRFTLVGDNAARQLQAGLQSLLSAMVPGMGTVRSLADLGLKTDQGGELSIDTNTLGQALARDPGAVNTLFSQASTGIAALTDALAKSYTDPVNGILVTDQEGLNRQIGSLTLRQTELQAQVDAYRASLEARFTAMEAIINQLKTTGSYLTSLSTSSSSGSSSGG